MPHIKPYTCDHCSKLIKHSPFVEITYGDMDKNGIPYDTQKAIYHGNCITIINRAETYEIDPEEIKRVVGVLEYETGKKATPSLIKALKDLLEYKSIAIISK